MNDNNSHMNKREPNHKAYPRGKSCMKPQVTVKTSALQRVLHQPASQQGTETPGTQWKEIDSVVNILNTLSLQYFAYRNSFQGGGLNRI